MISAARRRACTRAGADAARRWWMMRSVRHYYTTLICIVDGCACCYTIYVAWICRALPRPVPSALRAGERARGPAPTLLDVGG